MPHLSLYPSSCFVIPATICVSCLCFIFLYFMQRGRSILYSYLRHAGRGYLVVSEMFEKLLNLGVSAKHCTRVRGMRKPVGETRANTHKKAPSGKQPISKRINSTLEHRTSAPPLQTLFNARHLCRTVLRPCMRSAVATTANWSMRRRS